MTKGLTIASFGVAWLLMAAGARAQTSPTIEITLQPTRNAAGNVDAVHVTMALSDTTRSAVPLSLRAPMVLNNIPGIAERMQQFRVEDRRGTVALTTLDDPADASARGQYRHWRTARPVESPVTVRYRAIVPPGRIRAGPPYDLRAWAGGVSGGGAGVLALPEEDPRRYSIRLRWDVAQLAPGSIGVSSLGEGDAEATGPLSVLTSSWLMAGPLGRFPERPSPGFNAYWLGTTSALNPLEDMRWAASTYASLGRFFGDTVVRPYRFFLRALPESTTSGGTAGNRSFMLQLPVSPARSATNASAFGVRNTIAHEMIHGWAGGFAGAGQWASEGLTTYLTARTLLRLGLQPVEAFVAEINRLSRQYYANPYRNATTEVAAAAFWADRNGEVLPYVRGALYFFDMDAKIRAASKGTRSLDDVLLELFARRSRGETISVQSWKDALTKELGSAAAADVDSVVVSGTRTLTLPPDAFAPCIERKTARIVLPDFAFDRRTPATQTVVSLVAGSAAAAAGLRDGDVITTPIASDVLASTESRPLRLAVTRDGRALTIEYTSRPALVDSYEWSRASGVTDEVCRLMAAPAPIDAQAPAAAAQYAPVVTRREGVFNGKRVAYTATVSETIVPNAAGRPAARIVSTAYTADGADPATRPVLFACNGGPIAPSWPLHMLALGPRRLAIPPDLRADPSTFRVIDNVHAVLDVADIVFFDPASTGWSRVLDGIRPEEYYSVEADAQQMAAFVDRWLREHNRMASPKYLLGESYATIRVPETAKMLLHLPEPIVLDGVFLMGQATNQLEVNTRPYNILAPVIGLPSVAATAWYHNRVERKGRTVYQVMREAMQFADTEYLTALFKGGALDSAGRARIATRLESFTAIPAAYFLANNLRITRPTFQTELFRKDSLKLGSDDARYIGPANGPEPDAAASAEAYKALLRYFREELKVDRTEEYRQRQFPPSRTAAGGRGGGGGWEYARTASPFADFPYTAAITEVMNANPRFRVVVGSGIYDMKTTTGAAEYLVAQSGWPKSRTRISHYEGGHMAYTNENALKKFADDIRQLVRGQ